MNENPTVEIKNLQPITKFIYTLGVLPTSYLFSMTYQEQLTWLCNYISQTLIPAINTEGEAVQELQQLYKDLQDYVDNYFENLDVQAEIDNKLDEMVDNGTLENIIEPYLKNNAIFVFSTVADLQADENLVENQYVRTLGYYSINDGGDSLYKIRALSLSDTIDGSFLLALNDNSLVAELIVEGPVNFKQIGGKADNSSDNSTVWGNFIASDYKDLYIPEGNYKILSTIYLKDDVFIHGAGYSTILMIQPEGQLTLSNIADGHTDIRLRDFTIRVNGERDSYAILLYGLKTSYLENMTIRSDTGVDKYNGVALVLGNASQCYDNTISNCRFNRTCLSLVNSTDNFIIDNMIWANNLDECGSINIEGNCGNNTIRGNHLIGNDYGEIYIKSGQSLSQAIIDGNYFDNSTHGIYGNRLEFSSVTNNRFWDLGTDAINLSNMTLCSVANNNFVNVGHTAQSSADVVVATIGASTLSGNTHIKTSKYTYSTTQPCYTFTAASGSYTQSIVANTTCGTGANFAATTATTNVNYVNCYPSTKFPS